MTQQRLLMSTIPLDEFEEPFTIDQLVEALKARLPLTERDDMIEALLWPVERDQNRNNMAYIIFPEVAGIAFIWQLQPGPDLYSCSDHNDLVQPLHTPWGDPFPRGCVVPFDQAWQILREFADDPEVTPRSVKWMPACGYDPDSWSARQFHYSRGNEWGPDGRFGAYTLSLDWQTGDAIVERRSLCSQDRWQLGISAYWRQQASQALADSPFPASDFGDRAADSVWRTLEADGQRCTVGRQAAQATGWQPLFQLLDGVIWLVFPDQLAGQQPTGIDPDWVIAPRSC